MDHIIQMIDGSIALRNGLSPVTGDNVRPWIAAIILIVSVVVLIGVFVFQKKDKDKEENGQESYEDEDQ